MATKLNQRQIISVLTIIHTQKSGRETQLANPTDLFNILDLRNPL